MIRWCLYLRHLSSAAYETLRESGTIKLPSQRTLHDYTYHIKPQTGFSPDVDRYLMAAAKLSSCTEREKCIIIIMDEMYIRESLIYDKHTGDTFQCMLHVETQQMHGYIHVHVSVTVHMYIVHNIECCEPVHNGFIVCIKIAGTLNGFAELGDINSHLEAYRKETVELGQNTEEELELANSVLVMMVRGLCSDLKFPYALFPCINLTGNELYEPLWEAIYRLERMGFKYLGSVVMG